jgi:hypothetical protein
VYRQGIKVKSSIAKIHHENMKNRCMNIHVICLAFAFLWPTVAPARGFDVILDPRQVSQLLSEIAKFHSESQSGANKEAQLDALYEMGERVLDLTDLMTQDLDSHGMSDPSMIALIERRLKGEGVVIAKFAAGYHYDLAAFHEYLRQAPRGPRAVDARYVLIGFDEPGEDVVALQRSMAAKGRFIREYPAYADISVAELLLAQQHNQLARIYSNRHKQALSEQQRKLAGDTYRRIIRLYPKSEEAETAREALKP